LLTAKDISSGTTSLHVWNLTDGSKGRVTANTATTVTVTLSGGTDNDWDTGDTYLITDGHPVRDQLGTSGDEYQWVSPSGARPPQVIRPVAFWDNIVAGVADTNVSNSAGTSVQWGRDIVVGDQEDFTELSFPHPRAVVEDGLESSCTYTLDSSSTTIPAALATGSVGVTTQAACEWVAISSDDWITITGGASGIDSGSVDYSVAANTTTSARVGTIIIMDQTFTVYQAGVVSSVRTHGKITVKGKTISR
jgi:hypothetical protein